MESEIKIGPTRFQITVIENLRDPRNDESLDGHILYGESRIYLNAKLGDQSRRQTLWHEILHAVLVQAGVQEHDEQQIDALAYGVVGVLQDNPWLREPVGGSDGEK